MPYPSNAVPLSGPVGLNSTNEIHPTHLDILGQGGFRAVANASEMDAIVAFRRSPGMMVYVRDEQSYYRLTDSNTWELVEMSGAQGPQGPQGETGATGPIGPAIPGNLNFVGYYDSQASYVLGDVAMYPPNGTPTSNPPVASYVVMTANATGTPLNQDGSINTAGGWAFFATAGPAGSNGLAGPLGPQGIQGDAGLAGSDGVDGVTWYTGETTPDLAGITTANEGDLYLQLAATGNLDPANGDVYVYQNNSWVDSPLGNLQGPDGQDGGGVWPTAWASSTTATIAGSGFASAGQSVAGMTAFEILRKLLFPYISPTLTNFTVYTDSLGTITQSTDVVIGTILTGPRYFKVTTGTPTNFSPNTFKIKQEQSLQSGASYIYGTLSNPSQPIPTSNALFPVNPASNININTVVFTAGGQSVSWTALASSNQTLPAVIPSNTYTVTWRYPVFYGMSTDTSLSPAAVLTLPNQLKGGEEGTYPINFSNSTIHYAYFAYPVEGDAFGTFNTMKKSNDLSNTGVIPLAQAGGNQCTGCNDFSVNDGTGKFYKLISLQIGPPGQTTLVSYRLYRSNAALSDLTGITIQ